MPKIFLSYRRQDSVGVAGRIYDRLRAHFGDDAIFMDIDSIPFGVDFREHIDVGGRPVRRRARRDRNELGRGNRRSPADRRSRETLSGSRSNPRWSETFL